MAVLENLEKILPKEGDRFDQYELLEELGRCGIGVVYRAQHQRLEADVAVKRGLYSEDLALELLLHDLARL